MLIFANVLDITLNRVQLQNFDIFFNVLPILIHCSLSFLYQVHIAMSGTRTHNFKGDGQLLYR